MKKQDKKRLVGVTVCLVACIAFLLCLPVCAEGDGSAMPDGYDELLDSLPDGVADELPEGMFSESPDKVGEAVAQMSDSRFIFTFISEVLRSEANTFLSMFAKICGLLVLAAIFSALQRSLSSDTLSSAVRFCTVTAIFAAIIHTQIEHLMGVSLFFERLGAVMAAMIPVTGTVWAMGGNVSTASVGTSTLYVLLSVCERLCGKSVMPVCCILTALALCNTLSPEMGLRGFSSSLRRIYTFTLGMIMTLMLASLSSQTMLTSAADSTASRAAKLVTSNIIPTVGGSVAETLRTIASSVQYLKTVVGVGGIIFIALMLLPTLASLLMTRLAFLLGSGVADMLGCETEGRLLSELGGTYGIMISVVSMTSVMFIFALSIFSKTAVALM